jgi:hypothetical protein
MPESTIDSLAAGLCRIARSLGLLAVAAFASGCAAEKSEAADLPDGAVATMPAANVQPAAPADGLYKVGDVYETSEFTAKYLGMAKLALGNGNVWSEGPV